MPQAVYTIWFILLLVIVLVIVPLAVYLLQRTLNAAKNIERYFSEMAEAGVGIADNVSHISALEDTISVATAILGVAGQIKENTNTIKETLAGRAKV